MAATPDFNKKLFLTNLLDSYISKYINTNVNCHIEVFNSIKNINGKKKPDDILNIYEYIKGLFISNEFLMPDINYGTFKIETIKGVIYTSEERYKILDDMKDVLKEDVYTLINYIYGCLLKQRNIEIAFEVVAYLLEIKSKDIGNVGTICMYDILFNLLTYVSKLIDKDLHKYVLVSRELMYFKCTKKELKRRERLLYITIYVILSNSLDKSKLLKPNPEMSKFDYLYVLCEKDYYTMRQIQISSDEIKQRKIEAKKVFVDLEEPPATNIVKISF